MSIGEGEAAMEHLPNTDRVLGSGIQQVALGLGSGDWTVAYRSERLDSNTTEVAGLRWCRICGCVWAGDWPYGSCEEECWCAKQDDPWWHAQAQDYETPEEPEILTGSEAETTQMPKIEEDA